ncbi:30S ribosomal protein S8 [Patescibacteria group bacterium]|nr:30S ribosomal protein S8 [Patescibacteria group bacterium]
MNDLIADLLARMQNSIMRKERTVNVINTKMNMELLRVLKEEEMIIDFEAKDKEIEVQLAYDNNEPVIAHFTRVSKLGQRIYVSRKEITPVMNGRGIAIISTPSGLMSGAMAKSKGLGGELICKIW